MVIVALDIGVFIAVDNGTVVGSSLPNAPIQDINWREDALYAAFCAARYLYKLVPLFLRLAGWNRN